MQHRCSPTVMQCLMPSGDWRRLLDLRRLLLLASLIGFSLQTINMAMQYFHYHTSNQVDHRLFDRIIPAAVSLCFPLHSVRSRGRGSRTEDKTIRQIFEATPSTSGLVSSCAYRDHETGILTRVHGSRECEQVFTMSKYFTQDYICFVIRQRNQSSLPGSMITHSLRDQMIVYSVTFDAKFNFCDFVLPTTFSPSSRFPFKSRSLSRVAQITCGQQVNSTKKLQLNLLNVSPSWISSRLMQAPYDTRCVPVNGDAMYECRLRCLLRGLRDEQRAPFTEIVGEALDLPPVSPQQEANETFRRQLLDMQQQCYRSCRYTPCDQQLSITSSSAAAMPGVSFAFNLCSPSTMDVHSTATPRLTLIELLSFTSGCFGTWFGVSFMSLAPSDGTATGAGSSWRMQRSLLLHESWRRVRVTQAFAPPQQRPRFRFNQGITHREIMQPWRS